jgi:quinol monooxygenase YgiN
VVQLIVEMAASPGHLEDVLSALQAVMRPARLDRRCVSTSIWCDPEDACALKYVEEWLDAAQFALEVRGERIGRLLELMESATRAPTIEVRSIESVRGLDYLAAIRLGRHDEEAAVPMPDRDPLMRHEDRK